MLILPGPRRSLDLLQHADDWRHFLADPEKHWRDGRSAKLLAESWHAAAPGLPSALTRAMAGTPFERFAPSLAIPEYEVQLPGGRRPSQNDLFVLGHIGDDLALIMVEGKVDESFGPELARWLEDASPGKRRRLSALQQTLGLPDDLPGRLRYQLLHRTASPVLEAKRLGARYAAMVVQSFSPADAGHQEYELFAELLGAAGTKGRLERVEAVAEPGLWIGWVGDQLPAQPGASAPEIVAADAPVADELPQIVAHADWGTNAHKRWMCVADLGRDSRYRVHAPEPVGDASTLIERLRARAEGGRVLVGFDFPIGVPVEYARRAGVTSFRSLLAELGSGAWSAFYEVAREAHEVSVTRPFYPMTSGKTKGERRQAHLLSGLGLDDMALLLRECERPSATRGAASALFWTLGPKQVGKAAISGWRDVLTPALRDHGELVGLWPFEGDLKELLGTRDVTVVETYPAEACVHLGMSPPGAGWSKRSQEGRAAQSDTILGWLASRPAHPGPGLESLLRSGFGPSKDAEDPFDALLGALSMLEVVLGYRDAGAPAEARIRSTEGWILGQERG